MISERALCFITFMTCLPLSVRLLCAENMTKLFSFFEKKLNIPIFIAIFGSACKCIQMSTNRPSIGAVVCEIANVLNFEKTMVQIPFSFLTLQQAHKVFKI